MNLYTMHKILLLVTAYCFFSVAASAQKIININPKVSISLPEDFKRYANTNNPAAILFTDAKRTAVLTYRFDTDSITDNEIPAYADDLLKLAKQDNVSFKYIDDGIHLQDGKNIGYLKFSSKDDGRKNFNYIFFISVDDKPLVFSFSVPFKQRKKWEPLADTIANSLRVTTTG